MLTLEELLDITMTHSGWMWVDDVEVLGLSKPHTVRLFKRICADMNRFTPLTTHHRFMFPNGQLELPLPMNPQHAYVEHAGLGEFNIVNNVLHRKPGSPSTVDVVVTSHWTVRKGVKLTTQTKSQLFDIDSCGNVIKDDERDTEDEHYYIDNLTERTESFSMFLEMCEAYLKMAIGSAGSMFAVEGFPVEVNYSEMASQGRELRDETFQRLEDNSDIFMHLSDPIMQGN